MPLKSNRRFAGLVFAWVSVALVYAVFVYFILFLADLHLARTVDRGGSLGTLPALLVDLGLIGLFGLQHTGMARDGFKRLLAGRVPQGLQRTTYVAFSVLALFLVVHLFEPIPAIVWDLSGSPLALPLWGLFVLGWTISAIAYLAAGHLYLLGVRQALAWYRDEPVPGPPLQERLVYRIVRNPQQLGLLLAFWSTPTMSAGHLLLAAGLSVYIWIGMRFEERDLIAAHGTRYLAYRDRTPKIVPDFLTLLKRCATGQD